MLVCNQITLSAAAALVLRRLCPAKPWYYTKRVMSVESCRVQVSACFLLWAWYTEARKQREVAHMLGIRIAILRRSAGWSQSELAARLGVSASAVGMYEQGRRDPATDIIVRLSEIFGVTTDYLLTGRAQNATDTAAVDEALAKTIMDADNRLLKRDRQPFTREELAVLFAAMMLDS
jgi:transcriptional regulator with XRE-family HTH domain